MNIANESAILRVTDDDDDNHHRAGTTTESDEMDILATNVTHKSRSIEETTASIQTMCINPKLTERKFMADLESAWDEIELYTAPGDSEDFRAKNNCKRFNDDSVKLYRRPFQISVISDFLANASFTRQLVNEMCTMEWMRKEMDLYLFHQTTDLANLSDSAAKPALKQFHSMLTNKMLPWMREITGLPLTRVSASCSMYNYGDYLLVHDDLLSDRKIAFVFYLSPWFIEWTEQMGGALELFETDWHGQPKYPIVEKFSPRNNQFVFFKVCDKSFHQVGEVTNPVYPRLTINGWFHGPTTKVDLSDSIELIRSDNSSMGSMDVSQAYHIATQDDLDLNDWINSYYLKKRVKQNIQKHIENKSEASLETFLIAEFFDTLSTEFKSPDLHWVLEGPANQRKYERLRFARNATGPLKDLYSLFTSDSIFELLQDYTELDLSGLNAMNPTCNVQLCRFTQGCYTLLGDSTTFADSALDVILFFNARDGVGKITFVHTYLSPSQGVSTEYNTTAETDVTTATTNTTANITMDQSSIAEVGDISGTSSIRVVKNNASNQKQSKQTNKSKSQKDASECMDTLDDDDEDDVSIDESIQETRAKQKSSIQAKAKGSACKVTVRADVHEHQKSSDSENYDVDMSISSMNDGCGGGSSSRDIEADGHQDVSENDDSEDDLDSEELAQEDALLTIHPKNNSLNLVYRLSGQAKFVKYISKNSLKPDEYIYILFASYKE